MLVFLPSYKVVTVTSLYYLGSGNISIAPKDYHALYLYEKYFKISLHETYEGVTVRYLDYEKEKHQPDFCQSDIPDDKVQECAVGLSQDPKCARRLEHSLGQSSEQRG